MTTKQILIKNVKNNPKWEQITPTIFKNLEENEVHIFKNVVEDTNYRDYFFHSLKKDQWEKVKGLKTFIQITSQWSKGEEDLRLSIKNRVELIQTTGVRSYEYDKVTKKKVKGGKHTYRYYIKHYNKRYTFKNKEELIDNWNRLKDQRLFENFKVVYGQRDKIDYGLYVRCVEDIRQSVCISEEPLIKDFSLFEEYKGDFIKCFYEGLSVFEKKYFDNKIDKVTNKERLEKRKERKVS